MLSFLAEIGKATSACTRADAGSAGSAPRAAKEHARIAAALTSRTIPHKKRLAAISLLQAPTQRLLKPKALFVCVLEATTVPHHVFALFL